MGEISDVVSVMGDLMKAGKDTATKVASSGVFKPYPSSISSLALQGTANFPVLVSDSIDLEDALMVSKSLERKFATFLLTVLTMNPYMGVDKGTTPSAAEYLSQFHQNMGVKPTSYEVDGTKVAGAISSLSESEMPNMSGITEETAKFILEQSNTTGIDYDCWVNESLQILSAIYEGVADNGINVQNSKFNYTIEDVTEQSILNKKGVTPVAESKHHRHRQPVNVTVNPTITVKGTGDGKTGSPKLTDPKSINYLQNNEFKKANELVPTLLHVRVYPYDKSTSESLTPLDFIIGVKATLHSVSSRDMITNIARGLKNDSVFFNFIRWTTGETRFFKDFLFAIDQHKIDAKNSGSNANGWWSALKRRKASSAIRKFAKGKNCLPNATLVVSVDDLDALKSEYGFNLTGSDTDVIYTLMKQYFLLSFVRVNSALQRVDFLFDGNSQFETASYSTLSKEGGNDDRKFKDMMKMLGRGA